jgi:DNA-binding IclR family transcriptional regulator
MAGPIEEAVGVRTDQAVTGAQTLLRALDVLECLGSEPSWLTVGEVSELIELKRATTYRLMKALESRGYVVVDSQRRFGLGGAILRLAAVILKRNQHLVELASPSLEALRDLTKETVSLQTVVGDDRICLTEFVSKQPMRMESGVGQVYPLYAGAAGKALLAWLPDRVRAMEEQMADSALLEPVASATICDVAVLSRELDKIRAQGFATSNSEVIEGATSLAAPVFDDGGAVRAVINVTGPATRWSSERQEEFRPAILRQAQMLGHLLGSPLPEGKPSQP